jgi:hypothetical protein
VPTRSNQTARPWSTLSDLDRRAITVAGHLLMSGVWLERKVSTLPKFLGTLATVKER